MSTDERHAWRMLGKEDTARTNIKVVQMANKVSQREREREKQFYQVMSMVRNIRTVH